MSGGVGASHRTTGRARRARLDCIPSNMAKRHGPRTPVVLIVLDGWGFRPGREGNAVELGDTPTWHRLWARAPRTLLDASEIGKHTSELQSHHDLVCRLLLEKKKGSLMMQQHTLSAPGKPGPPSRVVGAPRPQRFHAQQ